MVTLVRESDDPYRCTTGAESLRVVANSERRMPDEYIAADGADVTGAFVRYARPLLGDPLPQHVRVQTQFVQPGR
jgi:6-phosphofructokinase 1